MHIHSEDRSPSNTRVFVDVVFEDRSLATPHTYGGGPIGGRGYEKYPDGFARFIKGRAVAITNHWSGFTGPARSFESVDEVGLIGNHVPSD